jgi:guanylate kinase
MTQPVQPLEPSIVKGHLIVLVGPSGVGKSTIAGKLAERMHLKYIASATTRQQSEMDKLGKTYEYVDLETFNRRLDAGEFLEYAKVFDEYYGTPKRPTLDYLSGGQDVLLEIDVQGALQVRFQYPDALMIFILPPRRGQPAAPAAEPRPGQRRRDREAVPRRQARDLDGQGQPGVRRHGDQRQRRPRRERDRLPRATEEVARGNLNWWVVGRRSWVVKAQATNSPQPTTHNPQPATRNPQRTNQ